MLYCKDGKFEEHLLIAFRTRTKFPIAATRRLPLKFQSRRFGVVHFHFELVTAIIEVYFRFYVLFRRNIDGQFV